MDGRGRMVTLSTSPGISSGRKAAGFSESMSSGAATRQCDCPPRQHFSPAVNLHGSSAATIEERAIARDFQAILDLGAPRRPFSRCLALALLRGGWRTETRSREPDGGERPSGWHVGTVPLTRPPGYVGRGERLPTARV